MNKTKVLIGAILTIMGAIASGIGIIMWVVKAKAVPLFGETVLWGVENPAMMAAPIIIVLGTSFVYLGTFLIIGKNIISENKALWSSGTSFALITSLLSILMYLAIIREGTVLKVELSFFQKSGPWLQWIWLIFSVITLVQLPLLITKIRK